MSKLINRLMGGNSNAGHYGSQQAQSSSQSAMAKSASLRTPLALPQSKQHELGVIDLISKDSITSTQTLSRSNRPKMTEEQMLREQKLNEPRSMAYVSVAEWTAHHVADWLKGLDDSILPYNQFFLNKNFNGCRLLLTNTGDLAKLSITKIGHQELILEAIELLNNLHYSVCCETLQSFILRLACKSRQLYNHLDHIKTCAEQIEAREEAARLELHRPGGKSNKQRKASKKDKNAKQNGDVKPKSLYDSTAIATCTMQFVSEILNAVKDFVSWIDWPPFDGQPQYLEARRIILKHSIELASTTQRDNFVHGPNEILRTSVQAMADTCDRLVQELKDCLAMQTAALDVILVCKAFDEDLGIHIHSSYSGVHVVGDLKYGSPAYRLGLIEVGDEIMQINYQTVIGWQLKKLVALMRQFPTRIIMTIKKRPRHGNGMTNDFSRILSYQVPMLNVPGYSNESVFNATSIGNGNANQASYPALPPPEVPVNVDFLATVEPIPINCAQYYHMYTGGISQLSQATSAQAQHMSNNYDTLGASRAPQQSSLLNTIVNTAENAANADSNNNKLEMHKLAPESEDNCFSVYDCSPLLLSIRKAKAEAAEAVKLATQKQQKASALEQSLASSKQTLNDKHKSTSKKSKMNKLASASTNRAGSSDSDCSSFSLTESNSSYFTSDSDDDDDDDDDESPKRQKTETNVNKASVKDCTKKSVHARKHADENVGETQAKQRTMMMDSEDSGALHDDDDNDSACYSGRNTRSANKNGSGGDSGSNSSSNHGESFYKNRRAAITTTSMMARLAIQEKHTNHNDRQEEMVKPRTSAEFEALYLRKANGFESANLEISLSTVSLPKVTSNNTDVQSYRTARAATLPPNTQPNVLSHEESGASSSMATPHVSTITHLTSLAKNIKTANTTTTTASNRALTECSNTIASNGGHHDRANGNGDHHNRANDHQQSTNNASQQQQNGESHAPNKELVKQVLNRFRELTNNDLEMKDHEDYLYIYKGDEQHASGTVPRSACDRQARDVWVRIRASLRNNTLRLYSDPRAPNKVCYELPVHLHGYHVLVRKSQLMSESSDETTLRMFTLVTYYRLFVFAVECREKMARWISRFGYRFCCNPQDDELCFSYYLSPIHAKPGDDDQASSSSNNNSNNNNNNNHRVKLNRTNRMARLADLAKAGEASNLQHKRMQLHFASEENRCTPPAALESDEPQYIATSSASSYEFIENDRQMQFCVSKLSNQGEKENVRRYAQSPHPICRFSTRVRDAEQSISGDAEQSISGDAEQSISGNAEQSISGSEESILENTDHSINRIINAANAAANALHNLIDRPSRSENGKSAQSCQFSCTALPELPPRSQASSSTWQTATKVSQTPRPKPRISKMASASMDMNSQAPAIMTSAAGGSNNFLTSSASRSSSCLRLAPIPVPQKSAAISQTIQHFANLTRQNVLRRSMCTGGSEGRAPSNSLEGSMNEYDQVSGESQPVLAMCSTGSVCGNPLYEKLPNVIKKKECCDATPLEAIKTTTGANEDAGSESNCSSSSSSDSLVTVACPPPAQPPPQPPKSAVVRDFILKANIKPTPPNNVALDGKPDEGEVLQTLVPSSSAFSRLHSPKMISRKKTPRPSDRWNESANVGQDSSSAVPVSASSPPSSWAAPVPPPKPGSVSIVPPVLQPRRWPGVSGSIVSPPATELPVKPSRMMPAQSTPASISLSTELNLETVHEKAARLMNANKQLNRSFSDAHAKRLPSGAAADRGRKSLESGAYRTDDDACPASGALSNSNRSLPTMGVAMLGKKKLSNVSVDSGTMERALRDYERQTAAASNDLN